MGKFSELEIECSDMFMELHAKEMSKLRNSVTTIENIYLEALKTTIIHYVEWRLKKENGNGNKNTRNNNRKKSLGDKAKQLTFRGFGSKGTST
jgi:hypothetical protein